jgi:hypothetical protein
MTAHLRACRSRCIPPLSLAHHLLLLLSHTRRYLQGGLIATAGLMAVNFFTSALPVFISRPLSSYGAIALLVLFFANQLVGAAAATGAFEVIDDDTGALYYSALRTGRIPRVEDVLAALPGGSTGGPAAVGSGPGAGKLASSLAPGGSRGGGGEDDDDE